jgi:UDP-2,3-diacylglucosamine pyrophosphatase LpxH
MRSFGGVQYINCGDWVESCSAVVEHPDGKFEIIPWADGAQHTLRKPELAEAKAA